MSGSSQFIVNLKERNTWRSGVRSAMHAASQLHGKGPNDVDDVPDHMNHEIDHAHKC